MLPASDIVLDLHPPEDVLKQPFAMQVENEVEGLSTRGSRHELGLSVSWMTKRNEQISAFRVPDPVTPSCCVPPRAKPPLETAPGQMGRLSTGAAEFVALAGYVPNLRR